MSSTLFRFESPAAVADWSAIDDRGMGGVSRRETGHDRGSVRGLIVQAVNAVTARATLRSLLRQAVTGAELGAFWDALRLARGSDTT